MLKNIAQIVVRENEISSTGSMQSDNATIKFDDLNKNKYYEFSKGRLNSSFWDLRLNRNSVKGQDDSVGLVFDGDLTDFSFSSQSIYKISFSIKENLNCKQKVYVIARDTADAEENSLNVILGYCQVPYGTGYSDFEIIFNPNQTFQEINFQSILFKLDREENLDESFTLTVNNLKIEKMKNLLPISETESLTIEVVSEGEQQFILNNEIFYIDSDKILEIPEEMDTSIYNLNFLNNNDNLLSSNICALINYRY